MELKKYYRVVYFFFLIFCFPGNLLSVGCGIAAIVVTGGIATPIVSGILGLSVAMGLASGGARCYFASKNKTKQDEHTKNLGKALITDLKSSEQFEEEFSQVENQSFPFTLWLKNTKQFYTGSGIMALRNKTKKVLPNLKDFKAEDKAGKEFLEKVLQAAQEENKQEKKREQRQFEFIEAGKSLKNNMSAIVPVLPTVTREIAEEAVKGVVGTAGKAVGGLAVGLGTVDST
jgi:hypothetical protein